MNAQFAYILQPGPDDLMISLLSDNTMTHTHTHTHTILADVPSVFFLEPIKCLVRAQTGSDTTWCISEERKKRRVAFSVFPLDGELGRAAYIMSFHQLEQSCGSVSDGFNTSVVENMILAPASHVFPRRPADIELGDVCTV